MCTSSFITICHYSVQKALRGEESALGHLVPMFKGPSSTDLASGLALLTDPSPHGLPPFPRLLQSSQSPCPPFPCLVLPSGGPGSENRASDGSGKVGPLPLQPSYFQEHPHHVVAHVSHCDLASGPASCLLSAPHHAAGGEKEGERSAPFPHLTLGLGRERQGGTAAAHDGHGSTQKERQRASVPSHPSLLDLCRNFSFSPA